MSEQGLAACTDKMREAGVDPVAIEVFSDYYRQCVRGTTGVIDEADISPLRELPRLAEVEVEPEAAAQALGRTVILRLNGGLGTSMGLEAAKTLLPVRDGKNFLDVILDQVRHARAASGATLPLIFLNSFRTRDDTLAHLAKYPDLAVPGLPVDVLQNQEPKITADRLEPVSWPADPELEWCPPGHGDLYPVLWGTGLLEDLIAAGYRYATVANGDNLGATPDARLAGWFAASGAPFAMEVCRRTANDRKGGHLARRRSDGRIILREVAQTAPGDLPSFSDENRHIYFNTNTLWLDLVALQQAMAERGGVLGLPLIRNTKTVDPSDPDSTPVLQLEGAMGAAIEVFEGATAIEVGRDRFQPVKTTNELLLLRSDVFELGADGRLVAVGAIPRIDLDPRYFRLLGDFEERFTVVPSLRQATSLVVRGEWSFDTAADVVGDVELADAGAPSRYR